MSEDHKPNRADERERIEAAGGVVLWAGTWRVGGVLAGESQCLAKRPFYPSLDRLSGHFCRLFDRLSDQFAQRWREPPLRPCP